MLDNISNDLSANIFEAPSGALNFAPIKMSGQYKIVIGIDNILWLDDYTGRRVKIDKSQRFLPQVSNFLRTQTSIINANITRYGGFNSPTTKFWHVPVYLSKGTEPTHFVVSKTINDTVADPALLQKYGDIVRLVDLEKVGVSAIFSEILSDDRNDYPLVLNWDEGVLNFNGYSIINNTFQVRPYDLQNNQANQSYFDVFNNQILNNFRDNNLIYPKFLNLELEFDYVDNKRHFNNFFGYLSVGKTISVSNFNNSLLTANIKTYGDKIVWKQEIFAANIVLDSYVNIVGSTSIISKSVQPAQVRVSIRRIAPEDVIQILHADNTIYFNYIIVADDIKGTLLQTLKQLCVKLTDLSGRFLLFSCDTNYVVTIKANIDDDFIEGYKILVARNFQLVDGAQDNFRQITVFDVALGNNAGIDVVSQFGKLKFNGIFYGITDVFYFNGQAIIRLDKEPDIVSSTSAEIYKVDTAALVNFPPIAYLSVNSDFKAHQQFDISRYGVELTKRFITDSLEAPERIVAAGVAINKFVASNTALDILPYVKQDASTMELSAADTIAYDRTPNSTGVLVMPFNTPGSTGFITPNSLNMDIQFFEKNGNSDVNMLKDDPLRYHWFLIKSECPNYLKDDIRQFRYFTDKPLLASRLIVNGAVYSGEAYCETVFLGVKYQIPQKYEGFLFSVYLDPNEQSADNVSYLFEVDNANMTLHLKISKYFDFADLIRGANSDNPAFLDLGALYSVKESFNTKSEAISGFRSGGILICDSTFETLFGNSLTREWRHLSAGKWYICLKRSFDVITAPFDELFPESGDTAFYVYSSVTLDGVVYEYLSMTFVVKNIRYVKPDYVWIEDLEIKFFDTPTMFINKYGTNADKIFNIDKANILHSENASDEIFGDNNIIVTILLDASNQEFRLLNHDKSFSFKENYFELTRTIRWPSDSAFPKAIVDDYFVFPEFVTPNSSLASLTAKFENDSLDEVTPDQKITIFERNQIWNLIKSILVVNLRFKSSTGKQISNSINELLISQLREYTDINPIPTNQSDFISISVIDYDINLVIWKLSTGDNANKVSKINRLRGTYMPYLRKLQNEFEFQRDIVTNRQDRLFSLYDSDFGGAGVSATALWNEVTGNVLSSLFCMSSTLTVEKPFGTSFDIRELLKEQITLDEAIIGLVNTDYIGKINSNVNEYILSSYIDWLLLNAYTLSLVNNELGQKMIFVVNPKNKYLITLNPMTTYQTRFNSLIFNFNRR